MAISASSSRKPWASPPAVSDPVPHDQGGGASGKHRGSSDEGGAAPGTEPGPLGSWYRIDPCARPEGPLRSAVTGESPKQGAVANAAVCDSPGFYGAGSRLLKSPVVEFYDETLGRRRVISQPDHWSGLSAPGGTPAAGAGSARPVCPPAGLRCAGRCGSPRSPSPRTSGSWRI